MVEPGGWEYLRVILYATGIIASIAMAGHLLRLRHPLAKLLFIAMLVWAFNCIMLLVGVWTTISGSPIPVWHYPMRTVNVFFLAFMPVILYIGFWRINERNNS